MPKSFKRPPRQLPQSEQRRLCDLIKLEKEAAKAGYSAVAGIDEAGRGPLAGPVVAAACLFSRPLFFPGINDSKLLSPKKRKQLFLSLKEHKDVVFSVGIISHEEIDEINILEATKKAMRQAVDGLSQEPDHLLVDGLFLEHKISCQKVIHGDRLSQLIAAASILAKETRDSLMETYDQQYPEYGFARHKGYGTKKHREALLKFGPCPIHRKSFLTKILSFH